MFIKIKIANKVSAALLVILFLISSSSCKTKSTTDKTKRVNQHLIKKEVQVKLSIPQNFILYSYFSNDTAEYFSYKINDWIYVINLAHPELKDSINTIVEKDQYTSYGEISSFCFNGKDSLFLLLDKAILFIERKRLKKIILINELDTPQYHSVRFANLENAPVYYSKKSNEIIGQVYCSACGQSNPSFYSQKIVGGISLNTAALHLYNIAYPDMYNKHYYGFANHVYMDSFDSLTLLSFSCDPEIYLLNRSNNTKKTIWARSVFQAEDAMPLDTAFAKSREEKMRHMVTLPYYTEIRADKFRGFLYRFFLKQLPLKTDRGRYNSFNHKQMVLMVMNRRYEVMGEFELDKYYNNFISFVGKKGLYINSISKDPNESGEKIFKILTFE